MDETFTLQISNSLGNKFFNWDSQNETLITQMFLILRKSCLSENISVKTLNFISKWVEYVSLIAFWVARYNNEFVFWFMKYMLPTCIIKNDYQETQIKKWIIALHFLRSVKFSNDSFTNSLKYGWGKSLSNARKHKRRILSGSYVLLGCLGNELSPVLLAMRRSKSSELNKMRR